ncbi:MAG: hypothetical protein JRK26_11900 [Deltaproteobacteria bacterium]|nr:hypothetical protein [Deltaproteobacteria bacterium]
MILLSVFLLSLCSLTYEVLLTRVFSISQWNHLSFMVISVALFGFAASGTFLSIVQSKDDRIRRRLPSKEALAIIVCLYSVSANGSFIALNRLPLDYLRLPLEPVQSLYLLIAYLLLALPFFFTGLIIALAYALYPEKTALTYFATMSGSACGAVLPVPTLPVFGEEVLIIIVNLLPLLAVFIGGIVFALSNRPSAAIAETKHSRLVFLALPLVPLAVLGFVFGNGSYTRVTPSAYKPLSQTLRYPKTKITQTFTSLRGRMDSVQSPYIRFAPGLSLKFKERLPQQWSVFKDGNAPLVLYNLKSKETLRSPRFALPFSGYVLNPEPKSVLIILNGGGSAIPCAISSGARQITILERNPHIAQILRDQYHLPVINRTPRGFLSVSDEKFSIIHVEDWGPSLPGTAALNQGHLFTVEAFDAYLNHLNDNGVLILSRKLLLPPADSIRLWATAYESLRSLGIPHPEHHLAMLRNWEAFTLVVTRKSLKISPADQKEIRAFARNMNFDLVFIPGITQNHVNRYNVFDAPYHYREITRLLEAYHRGSEEGFFASYLLDVAPQSDNRPFPSRFLKWKQLRKIYRITGSRMYSLFLSGEIVVAVVFIEALLISLTLLIVPMLGRSKIEQGPHLSSIVYFIGIGSGFMFIELYFIKLFTQWFDDPIVSFAVVLSGILISSGTGGFFSKRLSLRALRVVLLGLLAASAAMLFVQNHLFGLFHRLPDTGQVSLAFAILFPIGFLAGFPFPLGMKYFLRNPTQRSYAWAVNGATSVLAAIASAQIALSLGIAQIVLFAVVGYFFALFVTKQASGEPFAK